MSEMVERVARSLHRAHYERGRGLAPGWDSQGKHEKEMWLYSARAAVKAMREPTEAMTSAGEDMLHLDRPAGDWVDALWERMIDAALAE